MKLPFVKLSPNENMTILIPTPVKRSQQLAIGKKLMDYGNVYAEQVGFIETAQSTDAQARLQMMAGEFCGNATLSLAAYLFDQEQADIGTKRTFCLEVSGHTGQIQCDIQKEALGYHGFMDMPLPKSITKKQYLLDGVAYDLDMVDFGGIVHIVVPTAVWGKNARMQAERAAMCWQEEMEAEAFGILLLDEAKSEMSALVCVKGASLVWERGCASGTAACGAVVAMHRKESVSLHLQQAGGCMDISAQYQDHEIVVLRLGASVRMVAEGIAYI